MLILGRRVGEEIRIGDAIRLVVVGIRGSQVRLGFEAPDDVAIKRSELSEQPLLSDIMTAEANRTDTECVVTEAQP